MILAKETYRITRPFPRDEIYGLTSQIRRAAVSIPSNIAEGWGRKSRRDFIRFLTIARGSATELESEILLSSEIGYLSKEIAESFIKDTIEIGKMLNSLIKSLQAKLSAVES
jgi:four helix bundle protein